jgi:hypothetical protein
MAFASTRLSELQLLGGLARHLPAFLRQRLTPEECRAQVERDLRRRAQNLLHVLEFAVFAAPRSPYARLFAHAGVDLRAVTHLVEEKGVEGALQDLFDAGVYLRLDEFKGRRPIRRGSLEVPVTSRDFNHPLSAKDFAVQTGGSRSGGTRLYIDLEHYAQDATRYYLFLEAFDLFERSYALWRPTPPWHAGIKGVLRCVKLGKIPDKWFSQNGLGFSTRTWKHALLTATTIYGSRVCGVRLPVPEHVPLSEAWRIADWLATKKREGRPAVLNTNAASGVRVALAAEEKGLDIAGTLFRVGGEPVTPAKVRVFERVGARVTCPYNMGEAGILGLPCARPGAPDDVHVVTDSVALIQRSQPVGIGPDVMANVYTTLLPNTPKLMINMVSDDYGVVERRSCGCPLERIGYDLHLHTIRSHEKLTSEGMNFLGADLIRLVEEVLPARFGGAPTDYQLVEEEAENGLPKVSLVVSPRVGPLDEHTTTDAVVGFLNHIPGASDAYGERWRQGGTLRLIRREPYATGASKILALHVTKPKPERPEIGPA